MSKDKKRLVPVRRFKEFENAPAWEQRKLTEIVNRVNKSSNSDVLPKVEFEDIVSGEGRLNKDISSKLDSRKGTLFESENILYGKLRPYLKNWLFPDFEGVALGDFWVFEATDVSVPSFDYYLIQSDDYQKVANDTSGTKMPRSDWKNVSSTDFAIPSKDEQKQIGAFFKQLDDTITLHQRKLDKLKRVKSAYLTEMFPAEGEREPKRRFPGFTVAWEQRKLGEITKTHSFKQYISEAFDHGKYMVIQQGENPIAGYANGDPFENFKDVTLFGDHTLSLFKPQEKFFVASDGIKILSPSLKMNGMFYYYLLEKYRPQSEGYKRHFTIMKKSTALFPIEIDEQIKISNFLEELDSLIALHQRKLDKLKKMKAAYLEEMFV